MYDGIESQAQLLVTWVKEMQAIVTNPYSNGLNIERVLKDLQGFADNLYSEVQKLKTEDVEEAEVTEKAE